MKSRPLTNPIIAEMEQRAAREIELAVERAEFGKRVLRARRILEEAMWEKAASQIEEYKTYL